MNFRPVDRKLWGAPVHWDRSFVGDGKQRAVGEKKVGVQGW